MRSWELKVKDRSSRGGGGEDGGLKEFGGIRFCYDKISLSSYRLCNIRISPPPPSVPSESM